MSGGNPDQALRRLELTVVRRLDGLLQGRHQGLIPGPGSEHGDSRVYVPGEDDVRRMDWAVTARTTVPHVRDLIADRELETWALADLSASMEFGTAEVSKRDLVISAVGAIGILAGRVGDRFGAYILYGDDVHRYPARQGRPRLYALLHSLLGAPPAQGSVDLGEGLEMMAAAHRKRGLRVVVSDFLDPADSWEPPLRRLAARHQVLAVEVVDPRELELPDVGFVTLTDPETGRSRGVHLSRGIRERYAEAAAEQRWEIRTALRRAGAAHLVLRTDRDWVFDLAGFVLRQRRTAHLMRRAAGRRAGA
ncbi:MULTISPECIES: DUF58 domain-containing protein [Microbispora]|uniref:DUF58 domain-containing protein n=3 Tax=Microbispora TaxID=2005 RepID=A0ABY3LVC3_9ACTN|nr:MULTISPECIES: DUF58 domain-containing protein [Microbispora]RGA06628.1 DUF58 domain-containing protein [Microbispora triticiradicis]TLP60550.1 DUF58 domain-containing protein [Microbispora fusca]TYB54838.1 DUF58 domain-containing protein [Microbispora tritici]GLW20972.1 hypothetical protein Mame01_10150 [Microbispora amethystogenes]